MLRNLSRAMSSKQGLMADHSSQSSCSQNYKRPAPSFFGSPRFGVFTVKNLAETEVVISPTSILDTKRFSPFGNLFSDDINPPIESPKLLQDQKKRSRDKLEYSKGIGLALIDVLTNKTIENPSSKLNDKKVFFATKLRVQAPPLPPSNPSPTQSPKSPADFGTKTVKCSQLLVSGSANSAIQNNDSPIVFTGCLPLTEMELSEEYTCVISHGPNPKTTHIFDNCVIESYCSLSDNKSNSSSENFLSFCYTCKKNLEQKNDIYIYRGEKAFCSQECRYQEMLLDEVEN